MPLDEMTQAELDAWHDIEAAERALHDAHRRFIAATTRARRLRRSGLKLVQPQEETCRLQSDADTG